MLRDQSHKEIRQQLEAELLRLQGHSQAESPGNNRRSGANLDRADLAHNYSVRERQRALSDVEESKKMQIEEALERLVLGVYGQCTSCGRPIEPGRLEIMPYALNCVGCQKEQEEILL